MSKTLQLEGSWRKMEQRFTSWFSGTYAESRERFCEAVTKRDGTLYAIPLGVSGPEQEPLSIDIGYFGSSNPRKVLLHTSGLHGIEGFAGSAIQLKCLDSEPFDLPADQAIVFVHALNPYGMAWLRRVNENNVDLNRNFLPAGQPYQGACDGYRAMHSILNPESPPAPDLFTLKAALKIFQHGYTSLKQAITEGQYVFENGLFFGGKKLEEGPRLYIDWLENHLSQATDIFVIDVHTGLGKSGVDTLLVDLDRSAGEFVALKEFFGANVASWDADTSVAYKIHGGHSGMFTRVFSETRLRFLTQEFGTIAPLKVLHALREENRWHHYGNGDLRHTCKEKLRRAFCPRSTQWDEAILSRGMTVYNQSKSLLFGQNH